MPNVKRPLALLALFVAVPALMAQAPVAKTGKLTLSVDSIMRGPELVGYAPENLRWSADSQKLYFDWRRPGEDEAATYVVGREGGTPSRLDDAQKKTVPPANGRWDKARKRVLFAERGDIVLVDAAGTRKWITRTTAGESGPRTMRLSVPGRHMALNALGALLAAMQAGADPDVVLDALAEFEGVRRRFELVGVAAEVKVFDDYAHHPTKVSAALSAVRALAAESQGRAIVVFQPHLYSRTQTFAREFGAALSAADEVFVLDVFAAREQPIAGISGRSIAEHVRVPVHYVPDFSAVAERVAAAAEPGDVVVTMGAGDVTLLGREILDAVRARADRAGR